MNLRIHRTCLIFIFICSINFSQKNMDLDVIRGIKKPDLVGDSILLESNTYQAFKIMEDAAKKDGFNLKIVSAYRGYDRQKNIWNNKYNKFTVIHSLEPLKAIEEIIRYSTIPGTSRHHWGTDIDIIDGDYSDVKDVLMTSKFEKGGIFYDIKQWLDLNSEKFGFFITYNNDPKRMGFDYEPWHYSYAPISKKILKKLLKSGLKQIIQKESINGVEYFNDKFIIKYINENILDINPDLK
ncbi:MAG: M15 family metallopeptidase [Flavobacteriales bacterium]|jgi:LAS superfamily LD-carboxypeptidase LdcB|tara:strand:+ start:1509 stop:2225 length:717 start_codon:yes stop_codon:yes gene_type:complete